LGVGYNKQRDGKAFLSWKNDSDQKTEGYIIVLDKTEQFLTFRTPSGNVLTVPWHRILKLKEADL